MTFYRSFVEPLIVRLSRLQFADNVWSFDCHRNICVWSWLLFSLTAHYLVELQTQSSMGFRAKGSFPSGQEDLVPAWKQMAFTPYLQGRGRRCEGALGEGATTVPSNMKSQLVRIVMMLPNFCSRREIWVQVIQSVCTLHAHAKNNTYILLLLLYIIHREYII